MQCSVSTKGSLFQSMLLLINPNTRLLLMITAAAGKNACNFNIFTALLHSILHFSYGTLLVKFQTEFLPLISSWPHSLPFFYFPFPDSVYISSCWTGPLLYRGSSVHTVFMQHLSFLSCLFIPTGSLSFVSLLILQTVLGSLFCPCTTFKEIKICL